MNPSWRDERGSATVEAVIGVPVFVLLILLAIMGGRVSLAKQSVDAAAADAARVASLSRDAATAKSITCLDTTITVDTAALRRPAGTPGVVTATVSCTLRLADLGLPGTASRTITATVTSPLDTWRERGGR